MATYLYYSNNQIVSGQATPFVGRQDNFLRFGERWADQTSFSLHGQLTGCTFNDLKLAQDNLIKIFNKDFQTFEIIENGSGIFKADFTTVQSISFPSNSYGGAILDYTVNLNCYKENLFSGSYGVLDPIDEWSYEESPDYTVSLTHNVSAKGFNTSSTSANGLINARNFVNSRTGNNSSIAPAFISPRQGTLAFCLKSIREKIDRFNGIYSINESYVADSYYGTNGLLRYSTNFDCNSVQGIAKIDIEGSIEGCGRSVTMDSIRTRYSGLSLYQLAYAAFTGAGATGLLNTGFLSNAVVEDPFNKKINFKATYDNNPDPLVYLNYTLGFDLNENDITTVTFQGVIKSRGDISSRWTQVLAYYNTLNPYGYAASAYGNFVTQPYSLNISPINESVSFNELDAEITVSVSWDDKTLPPAPFKELTYSLNFKLSTPKIGVTPLNSICADSSQYYLANLKIQERGTFSVEGNGLVCPPNPVSQGVSYAKGLANSLGAAYTSASDTFVEINETSVSDRNISFKYGWSVKSLGNLGVL